MMYSFILSFLSLVEHILVGQVSVFQAQKLCHFTLPSVHTALPCCCLSCMVVGHRQLGKKNLPNFLVGKLCCVYSSLYILVIIWQPANLCISFCLFCVYSFFIEEKTIANIKIRTVLISRQIVSMRWGQTNQCSCTNCLRSFFAQTVIQHNSLMVLVLIEIIPNMCLNFYYFVRERKFQVTCE